MDGKILKAFVDAKKMNKTQLATDFGMSKQNLYQLFGSKAFQDETISTIEKKFRIKWQKIKESVNIDVSREKTLVNEPDRGPDYLSLRRNQKLTKRNRIPFYDAEAVAGDITETEMSEIHAPAGTIDVGDLLSDSQAAIRIYGNSMLPNYPPGCVVGVSKCNDSFIEPGEVYVIETRDRRVLKRLFYPKG